MQRCNTTIPGTISTRLSDAGLVFGLILRTRQLEEAKDGKCQTINEPFVIRQDKVRDGRFFLVLWSMKRNTS